MSLRTTPGRRDGSSEGQAGRAREPRISILEEDRAGRGLLDRPATAVVTFAAGFGAGRVFQGGEMARARWIVPFLALALPAAAQESKPDAETLRTRERAALLDVRSVLVAARQYASGNGGYFGELRCLTAPESCLPAYPKDEAPLLDPTHDWLATRLGYVRKFHAGPTADEDARQKANAAPGSLRSFAFTVAPETPGETGLRSFCGDSTWKVCAVPSGAPPPVQAGRALA